MVVEIDVPLFSLAQAAHLPGMGASMMTLNISALPLQPHRIRYRPLSAHVYSHLLQHHT